MDITTNQHTTESPVLELNPNGKTISIRRTAAEPANPYYSIVFAVDDDVKANFRAIVREWDREDEAAEWEKRQPSKMTTDLKALGH